MEVNVSDFAVSSTEQLFIDRSSALDILQTPQVILIDVPCVVQPLEELSALSLNTSGVIEEVKFVTTGSHERVTDLDLLFANLATLFSYAFGPTVMDVVNSVSMLKVVPFLNQEFEQLILWASGFECVFHVAEVFNYEATMASLVVFLTLAFILQVYMAYETYVAEKKKESDDFDDPEGILVQQTKGEAYGAVEGKELISSSQPAIREEEKEVHCGGVESGLPYVVRSFVPVMSFVLLALMVSYLSGVGASVFIDLILTFKDAVIEIPPVFQFDFPSVLNLLRQAKVYTTALILTVGGFIFPMGILVSYFLFWLVPVKFISVQKRVLWTQVGMSCTKYYPITGYLLVVLAVGFRLNLVPDLSSRPGVNGTGLSMYVSGSYSYFCCLISMLLVALMNLVVYYCLLHYSKTHFMNRYRYTCPSKRLVFSVISLAVGGIVCFFIGGPLPFFRLTFEGLPAKAIPEPRVFSLFSLPSALAQSGGLRSSQANLDTVILAFVWMTMVVPIFHLFSILLMGIVCGSSLVGVKVKPRWVSWCLAAVEIWNLFAGLEVMVVLYLGTVPFVSQFAKYIIGERCGPLNKVLEIPVITQWLDGDPTCFGLKGELRTGAYFLAVCCICARVAHFLCHYLWKRYDKVEDGVSWTGGNGSGY